MSGWTVVTEFESNGVVGVFEHDDPTGYLYVYEPEGRGIVDSLLIYTSPPTGLVKTDVRVLWSHDFSKLGVRIWGRLYGVIDVATGEKLGVMVIDQNTTPITDSSLTASF